MWDHTPAPIRIAPSHGALCQCFIVSAVRLIVLHVLVLLVLVGWWTGSWSASVVHIFAVVAVVCVLEAVTDSELTTFAGRLFHPLTTLWLKKNFLESNLDLSFASFFSCPLRPYGVSADVKNCLWSICSFPVNSLYTSIRLDHVPSVSSFFQCFVIFVRSFC